MNSVGSLAAGWLGDQRSGAAAGPLCRRAISDRRTVQAVSLLDQLVGAEQKRLRNWEAESLRGPEVDGQLDQRGLLDRKAGRAGPVEHLLHVVRRTPVNIASRRAVADQNASVSEFGYGRARRQPMAQRQRGDALAQVEN